MLATDEVAQVAYRYNPMKPMFKDAKDQLRTLYEIRGEQFIGLERESLAALSEASILRRKQIPSAVLTIQDRARAETRKEMETTNNEDKKIYDEYDRRQRKQQDEDEYNTRIREACEQISRPGCIFAAVVADAQGEALMNEGTAFGVLGVEV